MNVLCFPDDNQVYFVSDKLLGLMESAFPARWFMSTKLSSDRLTLAAGSVLLPQSRGAITDHPILRQQKPIFGKMDLSAQEMARAQRMAKAMSKR